MGKGSTKRASRSGWSMGATGCCGLRNTTLRRPPPVQKACTGSLNESAIAERVARAAPSATPRNTVLRVTVTRSTTHDLTRLLIERQLASFRAYGRRARGGGEVEHVVDRARDGIEGATGLN